MEKIDPRLAQAVWQRVTQARQPMPQPPQPPQQPQPIPPQPVRPNPPKPNPPQPPKPNPQPPRPIRPVLPPPRPPMPVPPPPPKPIQPSREELRQWLAEIIALERGYRTVNAGRNTPLLRRMASEEQAHERRLAALYTELYGGRPEVLPGAAAGKRSPAANLRDLYAAEQRAVRQWREAAMRYPARRSLFDRFALGDRRHAEQVRQMMRNM